MKRGLAACMLLLPILISCTKAPEPRFSRQIEVRVALPVPASFSNLPVLLAESLGYYRLEGLGVTSMMCLREPRPSKLCWGAV
jgi:hypothetical protein